MPQSVWLAAFPKEDAGVVVNSLCAVWRELAELSSETFHPRAREPQLTELLCEQVRAVFKERTKLTGQWSYERRMARILPQESGGLIVSDRRRTDIEYFSDRYSPTLQLVFEFKKLNHTKARRDEYVGGDGMLRFVTGDYSVGQPVAMMVGILLEAEEFCVPPLITLLRTPAARTALQMRDFAEGPVRVPSGLFAAFARFDTQHKRVASLAPSHGTIVISHHLLRIS